MSRVQVERLKPRLRQTLAGQTCQIRICAPFEWRVLIWKFQNALRAVDYIE